jgi:hypothetical protein
MGTQYYAYVHARPTTVDASGVFYVGKGELSRCRQVKRTHNIFHTRIVNKYGADNILAGRILCSSEQAAFELEMGLIKCFRRMGVNLCNMTEGGDGISGLKHSDEAKKKISEASKKLWEAPEHRQHMKEKMTGRTRTEESKKRMSERSKNDPSVVAWATLIGKANKGKPKSVEARQKMSGGHKSSPLSAAHIRRVAEINRGRPLSASHKAKISLFHTGRIVSDESKVRISEAQKARYAKTVSPLKGRPWSAELRQRREETSRMKRVLADTVTKPNTNTQGGL